MNAKEVLEKHFKVADTHKELSSTSPSYYIRECLEMGQGALYSEESALAAMEEYRSLSSTPDVNGEMLSFEELFKQHQEFSIKTFVSSTPKSSLEGLNIEANEAIDELDGIKRDYDGEALPLEYVDCLMYLMDSITRAGIPLARIKEMFVKKLEINKNRKWKINKNGSYSHVK